MDSRAALMSLVMVALLLKGAAAAIHTVGPDETFCQYEQLQFIWSGTHNVANAAKDEYDNCAKTAKVLTSTSGELIDLTTPGTQYFICTIDDHCKNGQKLAISVIGGTNPASNTTPQSPPPPSSASALSIGTLFAILSSTIVMAHLT